MKLVINTEAELLAAKNENGEIIVDGDFECNIDIKLSFNVKALRCFNAVIGGYADIWGNADIRGNAVIMGNAVIGGNAVIWGNADIRGYADIRGDFFKIKGYLKLACIIGIKCKKLICKAVVPASVSSGDREFWADRFGIDTSNGCWDEFVERLSVVAPNLLKKKHWLPVERLMLESSLGKYRDGL